MMESIDLNAPDYHATAMDVKELTERILHLEDLFLYHIHHVNDILGVTGTPRKRIEFTEPLESRR